MIANDSFIHRLRIPRECIYFPSSRHSKWIDCGLYSNNTCKRLTDRKGSQEGGMDARIMKKKNESLCLPLELSGGYSHTRATLGEPTFPAFP